MHTALPDGSILYCDSNYDSGTHCGFQIGLTPENSWTAITLDEILDDDQIRTLEHILLSVTQGFINDRT